MIIDSHCHLNYEPMITNLDEVMARAKEKNVSKMLTISTDEKSFQNNLEIIKKYENVYGTFGIHPHEAKLFQSITAKKILEKLALNNKLIGIGESGFDFYYNHSDKKSQTKLFIEHIHAAQSSDKPLIVHTRAAEKETYELLYLEKKRKDYRILIHCFTGSLEFAEKLISMGCYISASGVITFKNSKELADTFKKLPLDKILVETDSPYLSPMPLRGKSNEPSHIVHTVEFLAKLKGIQKEEIEDCTTNNFNKLFKL